MNNPDNTAAQADARAEFSPVAPISEVDLHLHTTASDGLLTPRALVEAAAARGLRTIAITDHDTTDGVAEATAAAAELCTVTVLPGVELSTAPDPVECHMLGYFIDIAEPGLVGRLRELRLGRTDRGRAMVERLGTLGLPLRWERVEQLAGGSVGRPHIARAMVERGYVETVADAFEQYIGKGRPAYVDRPTLTPAQSVELIHEAGGVAVVAHPLSPLIPDLDDFLRRLVAVGLDGLEVYYGDYTPAQVAELRAVAQRHGLIASGGSDFHGLEVLPQYVLGGTRIPTAVVPALAAARAQRHGATAAGGGH